MTLKPKFKVGDRVKVASDNDNEGYSSFRHRVLIIIHVAVNSDQHPGYDSGMLGMGLYDLKTLEGNSVDSSLYDYELERV